jgi:hypothetical protein
MSTFTPNELTYLSEQRIGRLATADRNGRPHVVPTGFNIDGEKGVVEIGGHIHPDRGQKRPLASGDAGQGPPDAISLRQPSDSDDGM